MCTPLLYRPTIVIIILSRVHLLFFSDSGKLCPRHQHLLSTFQKSNEMEKAEIESNEWQAMNNLHALHILFPTWSTLGLNIIALCLE